MTGVVTVTGSVAIAGARDVVIEELLTVRLLGAKHFFADHLRKACGAQPLGRARPTTALRAAHMTYQTD